MLDDNIIEDPVVDPPAPEGGSAEPVTADGAEGGEKSPTSLTVDPAALADAIVAAESRHATPAPPPVRPAQEPPKREAYAEIDGEELLSDPAKLVEAMQGIGEVAERRALEQMRPIAQAVVGSAQTFQTMVDSKADESIAAAREEFSSAGWGEDFDSQVPNIKQRCTAIGNPGAMMDPTQVKSLYMQTRGERGLSYVGTKTSKPPVTMNPNPSIRGGGAGSGAATPLDPQQQRMAASIRRNLGLSQKKFNPSREDMYERLGVVR